jgi:hypothetical protein
MFLVDIIRMTPKGSNPHDCKIKKLNKTTLMSNTLIKEKMISSGCSSLPNDRIDPGRVKQSFVERP